MLRNFWPVTLRKSCHIANETRGVASLEFALISPVFFLIFIGIFEVGSVLLVQQSLETAILQVSRFGRTGDVVSGESPQQTAVSLATTYSFGLVDPSKIVLTVTPYSSFSAVPTLSQAPNDGTQNFGSANQPVLYTISYKWTYFTPLAGEAFGKGFINLIASSVVQNEPFGS